MADKKKKSAKPLDKKALKKTKGGLLPAQPSSRFSGRFVDPPDPDLNLNTGNTLNTGP